VDSVKLAREIDKRARKINKLQKILVQINISQESSKSGTAASDAVALVQEAAQFKNISVRGLMGMPPFFDDPEEARPFFKELARIRSDIQANIQTEKIPNVTMEHLSMGMSGDFKAAIEEGATMVRIGTAIFGERQ
jgi:pyridoxal phosphate enzyme (YggS family)